jgi:hypothetical protein
LGLLFVIRLLEFTVDYKQSSKELKRRERWVAHLLTTDAERGKTMQRGARGQFLSRWEGLCQKRGVAALGRVEHFGLLRKASGQ